MDKEIRYCDFDVRFCDNCENAKNFRKTALNVCWSASDCAIEYCHYCYDCFYTRKDCQERYLKEIENGEDEGKQE